MYKSSEIKTVHLEITSKCNARCPMCLRTICGGETNPQLPLVELSLTDVQTIFPEKFILQLQRMYMCGNYGDPIVARETLEVFEHFRQVNPQIHLAMFTNGSAQTEDWWKRLARTVNLVHFSVDGLEDTNHLYRRGTHFKTILKNIKIYKEAGGKFVWDFIVFKHNEHQVDEIRELALSLGAEKFNLKKTGRFFSNMKMERKDQQVVLSKSGEIEYTLEQPLSPQYQNKALMKEGLLIEKYGSLEKYLDQTPIDCKVAHEKSIYVSAVGHVFPCCWTANQLYPWYYPEKKSYMWKLTGKIPGGVEALNAKLNPVEEIIDGVFFQKILLESWNEKSIEAGKPKCCAKTCGKEFDPFKAQFSPQAQA